jgi:3-oxoacyl-[acyl-carrier-protein] synthase II
MGAVTPIGNTIPAFWAALAAGKNGIGPITRFDTAGTKYRLAAELKGFDPQLYMDKAAVHKTDLFVQYAVAAGQQAVDDSGILATVNPARFGVYFGSGIGGFTTMCEEHRVLLEKGPKRVSPLFVPKMISNMAAGMLAIRFGAKGACLAVSTACATGTTAIGEAYRAIRSGYADAVLCGGSEAAIIPMGTAGFGSCMALSPSEDPDAASLPFDKRRAGFVMGEGAGALVLEEYGRALKRGAPVYAEIVGYGATCDAFHVTAPDPEAGAPAAAIAEAAAELADIPAKSIYLNAHGTGTPLNDVTETLAIKTAFGKAAGALHISSTKSMTGHMLGAAGAAEAIASILALNSNLVPPTIHLKEADPACDLDYTPNKSVGVPLSAALSVSLGFGGHNACVAFRKLGG